MSVFTSHPGTRWAVPAVALVAIGASTVLLTRPASADVGLPPLSAQQLLIDVQQSSVSALSGTVRQSVDLGLPQLPGLTSGGSGTTLDSVASGTHTWRVWLDGPTRQRLALLGDLGESDVVRNGADLWLWSSSDRTAVHTTLPSDAAAGAQGSDHALPTDLPRTPTEAAQLALSAIDPTTTVTTTGTDDVAGRPAYTLVLTPKDRATRVAQVRISVDSATKVPLRVQVFSSKLANPAIDVGFTAVDFGTPSASAFTFTPPPGATVTQKSLADKGSTASHDAASSSPGTPKVVGTGWTSVVVASLPAGALTGAAGSASGAARDAGGASGLLAALPKVTGAWGSGHVVDGTLFSAVLTDDGRVAVGAVAPDRLYATLSGS